MNIWDFQQVLSRRLAQSAGVSIGLGVPMLLAGKFWRGVGGQFIGWAMVNLGIAFFGSLSGDRRRQALRNPNAAEVQAKERRNLSRLLWINTGLDVLYMVGGRWLTRHQKKSMRGMGWGIIAQGLFLFVFDLFHALALREPDTDSAKPKRDV